MILEHQGVRPIVGGACGHLWEASTKEERCPECGGVGDIVVTDLVMLPVGTPVYERPGDKAT